MLKDYFIRECLWDRINFRAVVIHNVVSVDSFGLGFDNLVSTGQRERNHTKNNVSLKTHPPSTLES